MFKAIEHRMEGLIFWSRWLQAPLYIGLIVAQFLYCYKFGVEVWHLVVMTPTSTEHSFLLVVLQLIDIVMVANLITMVVVGGYATFVSKLDLDEHADRPEWLDHIDPGAIKVKLAASLIGISGVHLLTSFILIAPAPPGVVDGHAADATVAAVKAAMSPDDEARLKWQVIIHCVFLVSTVLLALNEFIMNRRHPPGERDHGSSPPTGAPPAPPTPPAAH